MLCDTPNSTRATQKVGESDWGKLDLYPSGMCYFKKRNKKA